MRVELFQHQVERLRRVYSPTALNEERVKILWENFRHVDDSRFESAVNFLIGEYTTQALPAVSRFREAIAQTSPAKTGGETAFQKWDRENPVQPLELRREWAKKYGGDIKQMLRGIGRPLPYDKNTSVAEIDKVTW